MFKIIDRAASAIIRRIFGLRFFVVKAEKHFLPNGLRVLKWAVAPANATDGELLRIFAASDVPESDETTIWFYSSQKDIGRKPYDVAMLTRPCKGGRPQITRVSG